MGSFWDDFGIMSGSFWDDFSFCDHDIMKLLNAVGFSIALVFLNQRNFAAPYSATRCMDGVGACGGRLAAKTETISKVTRLKQRDPIWDARPCSDPWVGPNTLVTQLKIRRN